MKKTFLSLPFLYGLVLALKVPGAAYAQFTLNFQPHDGPDGEPEFNCNRGPAPVPCPTEIAGDFDDFYLENEPTPFLMENVEIDGERYIHYVVGDPGEGFAMEVYIRGQYGRSPDARFSDFASPFASAQNNPGGEAGKGPLTERVPVIDPETGEELVDPDTGKVITVDLINGRGDPTAMVVRQVLGGEWDGTNLSCDASEFCMEFLKDAEQTKPFIRQRVNSGVVTSDFAIDMREISYDDIDTVAPVVNTVTFAGEIPGGFDMATDIDASFVTGGRYTYVAGPGDVGDGVLGAYEYWDGGFNMDNIKWESYRDPFINPEINLAPYPNEF